MPDSKELAAYVAAMEEQSLKEENRKGRGYMVPPPPKPGEIIICQICGRPMLPKDFSKDPKIRQREFKWHIHNICENNVWDQLDRQTPGLIADRANGLNAGRRPEPFQNRH